MNWIIKREWLLVLGVAAVSIGSLQAGGWSWYALCRHWPAGCPDDYDAKPLPPCPPRVQCGACLYEDKPLPPCPPRVVPDACIYDGKPLPPVFGMATGKQYRCGSPPCLNHGGAVGAPLPPLPPRPVVSDRPGS